MRLFALCALAAGMIVAAMVTSASVRPTSAAVERVPLSQLDGRSTPTAFTLVVDVAGATSAKLIIDGKYLGADGTAPLELPVSVAAGTHEARVRVVVGGVETRVEVVFSAGGTPPTPTTTTVTASPTTQPSSTTSPAPSTTVVTGGGAGTSVDTVAELEAALAAARPGAVITVAPGTYRRRGGGAWELTANGTAAAPIVLTGPRMAVLASDGPSGDYALHVTGDHWRVVGLTVADAQKGVVLDGSRFTVLDGIEVRDIGDEAVHFRSCSSDSVLRNSYVHDTGRRQPGFGEGVYVGSARSNATDFACQDPIEANRPDRDNTERVLIEGNVFEDITAEGADLKEGTDSGILRDNVFRRAGTSGANYADSAVDVKGSGWTVSGNRVEDTAAPWDDRGTLRSSRFVDGFQTHEIDAGTGTANVFRANVVVGSIPGWGIGLYPKLANVVRCDNQAPGAGFGLVGTNTAGTKPVACTS